MTKINSNNGHNLRSGIGTLTENNLHASLIQWVSLPGDLFEVEVDGYIVDIVRNDLLIEIQIKNFSAIKAKILNLYDTHKIQLIHPIARQKWIIKEEVDGKRIGRRKSPKQGRVEELFCELIRTPKILQHPNFSICVLLIDLNEIWKNDGEGSWRRKNWSIANRYLVDVIEKHEFRFPKDLLRLLPPTLPEPFTNNDVATHLRITKSLAGKITYCLRKMDEIKVVGKHGQANLMVLH
jgi:hypothetical protein